LPSLFETRRRLPTSATAYYDVRATKPELFSPRRDGGLDLLPFLLVSRPLPCGSGDTRRAAHRPTALTPVLVLPGCPGLPSRDARTAAPPPRLAPAEHSEDRRARVEGPSEGRVPGAHAAISRACVGCIRLMAHADGVPLLGALRTSGVIGAPPPAGGYPREAADRPRPSFRRRPAKSAAFQKTGMPFTVTTREGESYAERLLPPAFAPALSLTPPALGPRFWRGRCC